MAGLIGVFMMSRFVKHFLLRLFLLPLVFVLLLHNTFVSTTTRLYVRSFFCSVVAHMTIAYNPSPPQLTNF